MAAKQKRHKERTIMLRVTDAEKEALLRAAKKDGLALSTWIRFTALRAAELRIGHIGS